MVLILCQRPTPPVFVLPVFLPKRGGRFLLKTVSRAVRLVYRTPRAAQARADKGIEPSDL